MYKIAAENLQALFHKIAADQDLYLPVKVSDQVNFKAWSEDAEVCLDTLKTVKSPKDAFFPQSENLYTCKKEEKNISIEPQALQEKDFVVFGMKACDVQGVKVLDNVFLSDPVDTFYAARRKHGTIVALACHEPEESCFCKVFGIDCADPAADVATWMIEGELYWKPLTEKGEALTKAVAELLTDTDETKITWTVLILLYGKNFTNHVWHVVPAHLYVRPASATISKTITQAMAYSVIAAGTPVCTLTLP